MISFVKFQKPNGKWIVLDCRGDWTLFDKLLVIADDIEEGPAEQLCAWLEQMAKYKVLLQDFREKYYDLNILYHQVSEDFSNLKKAISYIEKIVDEKEDAVLIFKNGRLIYEDYR